MPKVLKKESPAKDKRLIKLRRLAMISYGLTYKNVAARLGYKNHFMIFQAVHGLKRNYVIRAAISLFTREPYAALWGEAPNPPTAKQAEALKARLDARWCEKKGDITPMSRCAACETKCAAWSNQEGGK